MRWEITRSTADTAGELFEATELARRARKPPNGVFKALALVGRAFRFRLDA